MPCSIRASSARCPTPAKLQGAWSTNALAEAGDYQDALDRARIVGREQGFLIGVRVSPAPFRRSRPAHAYPTLAETLIDILAGRVGRELERQHGRMPDGQAAVVAHGKARRPRNDRRVRSRPHHRLRFRRRGADHSDGAKPLSGTQYYTRFTQRLIAALSAQTAEGSLYQVDMRLRPSGNQGPVATRLASFIDYQEHSAWTWEHLALTRARVVSGTARATARASSAPSQRCCGGSGTARRSRPRSATCAPRSRRRRARATSGI